MDFILLNDDSVIKQQQHVFLGYMLMYDSPHWDWTKHFMGIYGIFFGEYTGEIMGFNRFGQNALRFYHQHSYHGKPLSYIPYEDPMEKVLEEPHSTYKLQPYFETVIVIRNSFKK